MANPGISRERAELFVKTVEDCIRDGFSVHGQPSAYSEAGRRLNEHRTTVMSSLAAAKRKHGLAPDSAVKPKAVEPEAAYEQPADLPGRVHSLLLSARRSIPDITSATKASMGDILDAVDELRGRGINVHRSGEYFEIPKQAQPAFLSDAPIEITSLPDNTFLFGAVGDLHAGSKYCRWDVRDNLYRRIADSGAQCVFDTGNWIDGEASFNRYDIEAHGLDGQCRLLAERHPKVPGLHTYAVWGDDHEGWYVQREGVDVGRYAESIMRDHGHEWTNLGFMEAQVILRNANTGKTAHLAVVHPGGGSAYALSYSIQKIVESYEGGEKPNVGLYGHYHKLWAGVIRNVWVVQTGCFLAATRIETDRGPVRIKDIKVGDMVLTHKNRYRKVTRLYKRKHEGDLVSINYGRVGRFDQTITATPEHPILVERDGRRDWLPFSDVKDGDAIFVQSTKCAAFGHPIPYWMRMSKHANPMDLQSVRDKLSATKGGRSYKRGGSCGADHMRRDILPECERLKAEGWQVVPVGAGVIPDAVGFKDGKIVAFEIENSTGRLREFKASKYDGSPIMSYIDSVEWRYTKERVIQPRSWYEFDEETGMCKVLVVSVKRRGIGGGNNRKRVSVYNFAVEEDESYIAGRVAVHNCSQDQTPFMRKKRLEAHVGGLLIKLEQDPESGAIIGMTPTMWKYFNRGFYSNRWSKHGDVTLPERAVEAIR